MHFLKIHQKIHIKLNHYYNYYNNDLSNINKYGAIWGWGIFKADNTRVNGQNLHATWISTGNYHITFDTNVTYNDCIVPLISVHKIGGYSISIIVKNIFNNAIYIEFRDNQNKLTDISTFNVIVVTFKSL